VQAKNTVAPNAETPVRAALDRNYWN